MKTKVNIYFLSILSVLCSLVLFSVYIEPVSADASNYQFKRLWPMLGQPWYFSRPAGIAVDPDNNCYIADTESGRVQKFSSDGIFITKWGSKGAGDGQFKSEGVAIDHEGNVYIADTWNFRVQKFSPEGVFLAKWGRPGSDDGQFSFPAGIAVDKTANVYVADTSNHRIQKFSSSGAFIAKWGVQGSGNGEFNSPDSIAVDQGGNVYVADTDNNRIQKFDSTGAFLIQWGSQGDADGEFDSPRGIAFDRDSNVYVADSRNDRIQKFNSNGDFIMKWGVSGTDGGNFLIPTGLAIDKDGNIFVTDSYNNRIQKFSPEGRLLAKWESFGTEDGKFDEPRDVATDLDGNVYVADYWNYRIQKFSSEGVFITSWGDKGKGEGEFSFPSSVDVDKQGHLYVADTSNNRIQKFKSDGTFLSSWGSLGDSDGEFSLPHGIAVDRDGNVYVADTYNDRIQKFNSEGLYITQWGKGGSGDGEFEGPRGIAVDLEGNIYVLDTDNDRIQKFSPDHTFISKWGSYGDGNGQFTSPEGITVDQDSNVYVSDTFNNRIQKFDSEGTFITSWGRFGSDSGMMKAPRGISIDLNGNIYVADTQNHRVHVFAEAAEDEKQSKIIIVAGGGDYKGNSLWDATQLCANYAYRALTYQGYTKDSIYYLSSDLDLDLDGNNILDDVDGDATNSNLKAAITTWAADATDLTLYITDHGGNKIFRMGETELLTAQELNSWLDQIQAATGTKVTIIYDACQSGSFLSELSNSDYDRIFVSSTSQDQQAHFTSVGQISFSYYFWGNIFNGASLYDSFLLSKDAVENSHSRQTPLLNADGNTTGNEDNDMALIQGLYIGNGVATADDIPVIGWISGETALNGETQASIFADNVIDANGISRVWAVITPPDDGTSDPSDPVLNLPQVELIKTSENRYEASYSSFTQNGTYNVAVFARDGNGTLSLPKSTSFIQTDGDSSSSSNDATVSAVIKTKEAGDITAVWKKGGEDTTSRGDRVVWGHFYADPNDVSWGSQNNPEIFVKIWYDAGGRVDVNFFHVSVPDIEVSSTYGGNKLKGTASESKRYLRQYYNDDGYNGVNENSEDGVPATGYKPANNPYSYPTINSLNIGAKINTVEAIGSIDGIWTLGGTDTTSRGDQVVWGYFYADPSDVSWGSKNNPELFVKVWFDASGRIDVNYFHVSVPDIEVYSDYGSDGIYDTNGTTIMDDRYIRHEYTKQ